jgi:hypothetical protein
MIGDNEVRAVLVVGQGESWSGVIGGSHAPNGWFACMCFIDMRL